MKEIFRTPVIVVAALFAQQAQAEIACEGQGITTADKSFCSRCRYQAAKATKKDTACTAFGNIQGNYVVLGSRVEKPPRHGTVSSHGWGFAYTPSKGFVGTDAFSIEYDFVQPGTTKAIVFYGDYTMTVHE